MKGTKEEKRGQNEIGSAQTDACLAEWDLCDTIIHYLVIREDYNLLLLSAVEVTSLLLNLSARNFFKDLSLSLSSALSLAISTDMRLFPLLLFLILTIAEDWGSGVRQVS